MAAEIPPAELDVYRLAAKTYRQAKRMGAPEKDCHWAATQAILYIWPWLGEEPAGSLLAKLSCLSRENTRTDFGGKHRKGTSDKTQTEKPPPGREAVSHRSDATRLPERDRASRFFFNATPALMFLLCATPINTHMLDLV